MIEAKIKIKCSKCSMVFRERVERIRNGFQMQCPHCLKLLTFDGRSDDYNETVTRLVRDLGFTCALTARRGLNDIDTPVLELRRGGPWEHHLPTFALKLAYYSATGA